MSSRTNVNRCIENYLRKNHDMEVSISDCEAEVIEITPSAKMLSGLLTRAVTGVNSRAVTPPLEVAKEKAKEKTKKRAKNEKPGAVGSAPPPLFRRLSEGQTPAETLAKSDTDLPIPPPVRPVTPPSTTPGAASATKKFIWELRKIGRDLELTREERREMKE